MAQNTNLNVSPYYDDFNRDRDFYRVLFRPGYSVQSRELTTLQSILQEQIERYGNYSFKQGELVIPGEVGFNTKFDYVKLSSVSEVAVNVDGEIVFQKYDITQLIGSTLVGVTSGVQGIVKEVKLQTTTNSDTIYVSYINSGDSNTEPTFRQGELLEVVDGVNTPVLTVGTDGAVLPNFITITDVETGVAETEFSPALGFASAVNIQEGIYFVNGFFVRNSEQLLIVDPYTNKGSAKIAFNIEETLVTPEEDNSLYDNARGSSNFSSPGAHRLKIELVSTRYDYNAILEKNSIELLSIKNGTVEKKIKSREYNVLEETLARRTFDESGDYVVDNFTFDVREYYQRDDNTGLFTLNSTTGLVNEFEESVAKNKLVGTIGPGKAYVKGYEIVNKEVSYVTLDKSTDTISRDNILLKSNGYTSFYVDNVHGSVPLNAEGVELDAYPTIYMFNTYNDGNIGLNGLTSNQKVSYNNRGNVISAGPADQNEVDLELSPSEIGIKTIWVERSATYLPNNLILPDVGDFLWVIQLYTEQEGTGQKRTSIVNYVRVLTTAVVSNQKVNPGSTIQYVEMTIAGRRDIVDALFKDFDLDDPDDGRRKVFLSSESAFTVNDLPDTNPPSTRAQYYWGTIVDYTETLSPLAGICKPANFYLEQLGEGFNEIKDKIASKGLKGGQESYNSIYSLSYFNPIFFTRITLTDVITDGFGAGKFVTGATSGAYGVIEGVTGGYYSSTNVLHVNVLQGKFIEGESVIDEDFNSLQIAKSNTLSHFVVHKQGNNYDSGSVISLDGFQYDKSRISVNRVDDGSTVGTISILEPSVRNTIFDNPPTVDISGGTGAIVTAVLYKDTVHTYAAEEVKSFYSKYGSGTQGENIFTADTVFDNSNYANYVKITDTTFSGTEGLDYLSVNSLAVDLGKLLKKGDIVQYIQNDGEIVRAVVNYATTSVGNEKSRVYLDSVLRDTVSGSILLKVSSKIENPNASLVIPTGSKNVSSLVKDITDSKISYFFRRDFVATGTSSSGRLQFAAQLPFGTQRFVRFTKENYVMTILDPGQGDTVNFSAGDIVYIKDEYISISNSTDSDSGLIAGTARIEFPVDYFGENLTSYPKVKLSATLEVSRAKPKLKTVVRNKRVIATPSNDKVIPIRGNDYDSGEIGVFSYSDVFKLRYVYEGTLTEPPRVDSSGLLVTGKDITDSFIFDNGQRKTYYDVARLILKPGEQTPTGRLVVGFDYFEHSQGEFCTVDSYVHESGIDIDEIPTFETENGIISLGDVIDFRPKVDTTVKTDGFQDASFLSSPDYISFTGEGGAPSVSIASDFNLEYTVRFNESSYLDRIDALFLDKTGKFVVKKGNSSKNPSKPDLVEDAIPLYYIYLPSLTTNSEDVKIVPVDNKRYTMRDISKLEKRVERLEYYTALSILEQQTLNMQIKDELGFERFKSGFLVDNFETHGVGDVSSSEYICSIDPQQSVLRAQVYEDNVPLVEKNTREDERFFDGYQRTNNIITLPYEETSLLGNPQATDKLNPNPFVVLQYVGEINIHPTIDQWFDTNTVPLVTNNNTNLFSIYVAKKSSPKDAIASIYNSFLINWSGVSSIFSNIVPVSSSTTLDSASNTQSSSVSSSSNISPNNNEIGKGIAYDTVNDVSVSSSMQFFARSIPIKFIVTRMKPLTKIYPFIDGRNVSRWTVPDGTFTGIPTSSLASFGSDIITDESGNASGIILLPAGYPPLQGTTWTGRLIDVAYDTGSEKINLVSGDKTIRFTSSQENADKSTVETYSEVKFYSRGTKPKNPQSIISTQPSYFKANEGFQTVESNTDVVIKPNPLAQTFKIENFDGGVFVTSLDLYFNQKSSTVPIKVYLTDTNIGKPGKNIVPGTQTIISPKTYLKISSSGSINIKKGDIIIGSTSGCQGPLEKVLDRNGNEVTLIAGENYSLANDQVYTFILSNHNGREFLQDEVLSSSSITIFNNTRNSNIQVKIVKDYGKIKKFVVESTGSNYDGAIVTVESPQLPGETAAAAFPYVSNGIIYDVDLSLSGSGYTSAPSVIVKGIGDGANGAVIKSVLDIDTPAVRMGVAVDDGTDIDSATPTTFKFEHPVYLQNDVEYTLQIETDSTDYLLWTSKLGGVEKITGIRASSQPLLGSLYRSQNTDTWVEDLFEDVKFTLNRAKFDISKNSVLTLVNDELAYEKLVANPLETSSISNTNATSDLFKANNAIVKVYQRDHGFEDSGRSQVFYRFVDDFFGISGSEFVSNYYTVDSCGLDYYTIKNFSQIGDTGRGGGIRMYASKNVKFEKLYADVAYLQAPNTTITSSVRTTNVLPLDSTSTNYVSYSTSDYETTFLNQEQYFENQKFVSSNVNEILNQTGKSLSYRIDLSSDVDYLSPLVDLRNVSVKTSSTRIDNTTGYEDRFGVRYQVLKFWPVYTFTIAGLDPVSFPISNRQIIQGQNSGASAEVIKVSGSTITVIMTNEGLFETGERPIFGTDLTYNDEPNVRIDGVINEIIPPFKINDLIVAYNSVADQEYTNIINGRILLWDLDARELVVRTEKKPINNDYTSPLPAGGLGNVDYERNTVLANQEDDIFRVGDGIKFDGSLDGTELNIKVKEVSYKPGVDYKDDIEVVNTSSSAKYLTKEATLKTSSTSLDVRMTANSSNRDDIKVFYRTLESSSQENLSTFKWEEMDLDLVGVEFKKSDTISGVFESQNNYQELKFFVNELIPFTKYQIKIVLKSNDPVFAPKVQDLRVVASV